MYSNRARLPFWYITLKDILIIISSVAIPVALAIYASTMQRQEQQTEEEARQYDLMKAERVRQQAVYDRFLNNIYKLDKNGYLADNQTPWAFGNAFYRSANRQWKAVWKSDALQFLKEHGLIGRSDCSAGCRRNELPDIIRIDKLSLEYIQLISQTGKLNRLKFDCTDFDHVLFDYAIFSFVNLNGALFHGGQGKYVKFQGSSLRCARFKDIDLDGVDFGDSDLTDTMFINVDLSNAKLTQEQLEQAIFVNSTLPKDISDKIKLRTQPPTMTTTVKKCETYTNAPLFNQSITSFKTETINTSVTSSTARIFVVTEAAVSMMKSPIVENTTSKIQITTEETSRPSVIDITIVKTTHASGVPSVKETASQSVTDITSLVITSASMKDIAAPKQVTTGQEKSPSPGNTASVTMVSNNMEASTTNVQTKTGEITIASITTPMRLLKTEEDTTPSVTSLLSETMMTSSASISTANMKHTKATLQLTTEQEISPSVTNIVSGTMMTSGVIISTKSLETTTEVKTSHLFTGTASVTTATSDFKTTRVPEKVKTISVEIPAEITASVSPELVSDVTTFNSIVNGGFETGDTTGWIIGGGSRHGIKSSEIQAQDYLPGGFRYDSNIASTHSIIVNRTLDPFLSNLTPTLVHNGKYALRVEDTLNNDCISVVTQTVNNYGSANIYFAWLAVMQISIHSIVDGTSPFLWMELKDINNGTILMQRRYDSDAALSADNNRFTSDMNYYYASSWQIEHIPIDTSRRGHNFSLTVVVADCTGGNHRGYMYIDDFGPTLPYP